MRPAAAGMAAKHPGSDGECPAAMPKTPSMRGPLTLGGAAQVATVDTGGSPTGRAGWPASGQGAGTARCCAGLFLLGNPHCV